jgi:hypothetical protein
LILVLLRKVYSLELLSLVVLVLLPVKTAPEPPLFGHIGDEISKNRRKKKGTLGFNWA